MATEGKHYTGIGWQFPPSFDTNRLATEMTGGAELIAQSLEVLLGTRVGERPMLPDFGDRTHELLFGKADQTLITEIEILIEDCLIQYEPRIDVNKVLADDSKIEEGILEVSVDYTIRKTNSRYNKVFPFYLKEGTLL